MRVKIGNYINRFTTEKLDDLWYKARHGVRSRDAYDVTEDAWDKRWEKFSDGVQWLLNQTVNKIQDARKRKIVVKLDRWDTWSADTTLGYIILPMLKQLKATKHGGPNVADADVPEHLRSSNAPPVSEYDTDELFFDRWDWVMDEMIFAFECVVDDSWEDAFHTGEHDWDSSPVDAEGNEVPKEGAKWFRMVKGPNDTHQCDYEGMKKVQDRISNGLMLFGKYYQALWD